MFKTIFYYLILAFILITSLVYYAPFNDYLYNSDHAIHVLMAKDFQFPRDIFYWGQNRLGSFFPLISFFLSKILNIHLLYISTITLYLFLLISFAILSKHIAHNSMKIALFSLIFMPLGEYHALILIGHPYCTQLLSGVLFIYFLYHLKHYMLSQNSFNKKTILISSGLITLSFLFYFVGVWTSELNLVFILIPFFYVVFDKPTFDFFKRNFKNVWLYFFLCYGGGLLILCLWGAKKIKTYSVEDAVYDNPFLTNYSEIKTHFQFFLNKLKTTLFFRDTATVENFFYWFLITLVILLVVRFIKNPKINFHKIQLHNALFILTLTVIIMLFFSRWNYRSEFAPRYFTPIYIPFCYALIILFDKPLFTKKLKTIIAIVFFLLPMSYCYSNYMGKQTESALKKLEDYTLLPEGTLFGDYWEVYKIASVAIDNLYPLPYDHLSVRNYAWKDKLLLQNNFYLPNTGGIPGGIRDTIFQFGLFFKFSGTKYNCNGTEVLKYHKLYNSIDARYKIKAANNKYLSVNPSSLIVTASETSHNKAESFLITQAWGKWLIKRELGDYLALDEINKKIYANHPNPWGAALMDLNWNANNKMSIIASNEKTITINLDVENALFANANNSNLEGFTFEK
ncbi:MAG: hypothetical protein J5I47_04450 [Vicingus serpentipes]|nr:hypothetical protein [Vicingus serpentipes]